MSRATEEWIGKTADTAIPARVKNRISKRFHDQCAECHRNFDGREKPQFDHVKALVNGGANAESNLQPLCELCHGAKTKVDVAEKSHVAGRRATFLGFREKAKWSSGNRFRKSPPQNSSRKSTKPVLYSRRRDAEQDCSPADLVGEVR